MTLDPSIWLQIGYCGRFRHSVQCANLTPPVYNKPYAVREKGVYVRANATDRIATRYELDEFYEERRSQFRPYY